MALSSTDNRDIRKFGAFVFCFFVALFVIALWRQRITVSYLLGCFSFTGFCFLVAPAQMKPIYKGWLKLAHYVGLMMTFTILTVVYYIAVTPTALLKRLLGGRPIPTAPDKKASTYWVSRTEPVQPRERFVKRY